MSKIKMVDTFDITGPGRPISQRTQEIGDAIESARSSEKYGLKFELMDDERGSHFYRFTQRARAAAERVGVKVNVSISKSDPNVGNVRILGD